ncbi:MAG: LapA family protein [Actinomycetes bacterium]|jgi:uncharacterized integral membrane protein|nr:hypothetical protein [Candidatus Nanopelagicales bacterium]MDP4824978.1 hypothetical protein [Candidatus Nanopelagicales bacterium]MDP4887724.1 hypothetical protein [Candidatus Nanopelagicales bacterium]
MSADAAKSQKQGPGVVRTVVIVIVSVAAVLLVIFNSESTQMWLFGFQVTLPLFLILIVMFVLGMLLGGVVRSGLRKLSGKESTAK